MSPLVLEAELRMLRASLTLRGTEVGGCGGADEGNVVVGPKKRKVH